MEDFYFAGGLPALMTRIAATISTSARATVNGRTLGENLDGAAGARTTTSSARSTARSRQPASAARWRCCAATSRPTAR